MSGPKCTVVTDFLFVQAKIPCQEMHIQLVLTGSGPAKGTEQTAFCDLENRGVQIARTHGSVDVAPIIGFADGNVNITRVAFNVLIAFNAADPKGARGQTDVKIGTRGNLDCGLKVDGRVLYLKIRDRTRDVQLDLYVPAAGLVPEDPNLIVVAWPYFIAATFKVHLDLPARREFFADGRKPLLRDHDLRNQNL